jgi:hypothetical protein
LIEPGLRYVTHRMILFPRSISQKFLSAYVMNIGGSGVQEDAALDNGRIG